MKTTVEVSDALLARARRVAVERGTTLRALIEEGLRAVIERQGHARSFTLRKASYRGRGLRPDVAEGESARIIDASYEGRGG
jgi:hypothetical protein